MARCGCETGQCRCVITVDPPLSATGNGSPSAPRHITLDTAGLVAVDDTDTIDLTLTPGEPPVITGDVILSDDAGNSLMQGSDGGLFVNRVTAGVFVNNFQVAVRSGPAGATGTTEGMFDLETVVTNPSPTQSMQVLLCAEMNPVTFLQPTGNDWTFRWGDTFTTDGSAPGVPAATLALGRMARSTTTGSLRFHWMPVLIAYRLLSLAPSATLRWRWAAAMEYNITAGTTLVEWSGVQTFVIGVIQP